MPGHWRKCGVRLSYSLLPSCGARDSDVVKSGRGCTCSDVGWNKCLNVIWVAHPALKTLDAPALKAVLFLIATLIFRCSLMELCHYFHKITQALFGCGFPRRHRLTSRFPKRVSVAGSRMFPALPSRAVQQRDPMS